MDSSQSEQRTSLYLVNRAEALRGALRFFGSPHRSKFDLQLQFLAQIDFWDWELENLIFSFTNLAERSKTWRSPQATQAKLDTLGVVLPAKLLTKVRWSGRWQVKAQVERVAPTDLLREVIELWNQLIDEVEKRFVTPGSDLIERYNMAGRKNLQEFRKEMPPLSEGASEQS